MQEFAILLAGTRIGDMTTAEAGFAKILLEQGLLEKCNGKVVLPVSEYDKYVLKDQPEEVLSIYHALYLTLQAKPEDQVARLALADLFEEIGAKGAPFRAAVHRALAAGTPYIHKLRSPLTERGDEHKKGKYKYRMIRYSTEAAQKAFPRLPHTGHQLRIAGEPSLVFKTYDEMIDALIQSWDYN